MIEKNTVIQGDCISVLNNFDDNLFDLVYLDPPFFTQKIQGLKNRDNTKKYEFNDKWESVFEYLSMLKESLIEIKRVTKNSGSVFLHCDRNASHHIRIVLDEVFGKDNFQSEVIWHYKRWSNAKKGLLNSHQTIFFYSKTKNFKFNEIYEEYSPTTNIDQILQKRVRNEHNKSVYARDKEGNIILNGEKKGVPLSDVWEIPFLNPKAKERVGYPTQKPIILLERIIELVTDKNDIVLDPFCGSGTTLVASKILGRNYIGIDISKEAVSLSNTRLSNIVKSSSSLLEKGKSHYITKSDEELTILKNFDANPVFRNRGIDGFLKISYNDVPIPIRIQKTNESLQDAKDSLLNASKAKSCDIMVLVRTSNESKIEEDNKNMDNVILIDSYDLQMKKILNSYMQQKENNNIQKD